MDNTKDTLEFIISEDGSHTLYNKELNETYHSTHGAIQESNHVFIKSGLDYFIENNPTETPNILEVGMGTGLNVLLTALFATKHKIKIEITSLEKFPLEKKITDNLNYGELLKDNSTVTLNEIHACPWNQTIELNEWVSFTKKNIGLEEYSNPIHNLVYYDAFAPTKQVEMWTPHIFKKVSESCLENAIFVTYCAKGQVRRDLQDLGFKMSRIKGPPGKHEMLRGALNKNIIT